MTINMIVTGKIIKRNFSSQFMKRKVSEPILFKIRGVPGNPRCTWSIKRENRKKLHHFIVVILAKSYILHWFCKRLKCSHSWTRLCTVACLNRIFMVVFCGEDFFICNYLRKLCSCLEDVCPVCKRRGNIVHLE